MYIHQEDPNLVNIGQKHQALYIKTQVYFIVASNITKTLTVSEMASGWYNS